MNVIPLLLERLRIENTDLGESFLPDGSAEAQFLSCPKCEATLHKLHSALDCHARTNGDHEVEVIGHDYERMQSKFSCCTVVAKRLEKQGRRAFGLKQAFTSPDAGGNEKYAIVCENVCWIGMSMWIGHSLFLDGIGRPER